jgi:hypothetical protein
MPMPLDPDDWLTSADARAMLALMIPPTSHDSTPDMNGRLRRYLIALARLAWDRMPWAGRVLVRHAEAMADGPLPDPKAHDALCNLAIQYASSGGDADTVRRCEAELAEHWPVKGPAEPPANRPFDIHLAQLALVSVWRRGNTDSLVQPRLHRADLVRDVFPPPGLPASFNPMWRTDAVVGLAARMDATGEYEQVPMAALADALQEAGCEDVHILGHCRDDQQPHVRGCWVVEMILMAKSPTQAVNWS